MARLLLVVAAALILCGVASAATIDDLRALGYTVTVSNPGAAGQNCPIYYISGYGNSSYATLCDPAGQSLVDSWANPTTFCNVKWTYEHPDQLAAVQAIGGKGYTISGDQCADQYTVSDPNGARVYSGSGGGLPGLNGGLGAAPAAQPAPGNASPPAPGNGFCLPLCPPSAIGAAPPQPVTAASAIPSVTDPAIASTVAAILFPDRSSGYLARAGYGSGGALSP